MAKKDKLKDLSRKDLVARKRDNAQDIIQLKAEKKAADTPEAKAAVQAQIDSKMERNKKITTIVNRREDRVTAPEDANAQLAKLYSSDAFQRLSSANQQLVKSVIDLYTPEQLANIKITPKEAKIITRSARERAQKDFDYTKAQLDQDAEQELRVDTAALKNAVEQELANLSLDIANGNTAYADQRKITIRQLQDALDEAEKQYAVAAERKNTFLNNSLADIQKKLDTAVTQANEDEVLQLRQLQRDHTSELRVLGDNMKLRGLAFSGLRGQAEDTSEQNYRDTVTTAQLAAQRRREAAQTEAEQAKRDVSLSTEQELQDLIDFYTGNQRSAIQGAESELGTEATQGLIGGYKGIGGTDITKNLYGDITGSINTRQQGAVNTYRSNVANKAAEFEAAYGTDQFNKTFGPNFGATEGYAGYTPTGGVIGTSPAAYTRAIHDAKVTQRYNRKAAKQQLITQAIFGKLI